MSELRKAAQQALEALEMEATSPPIPETEAAITALRAALAQPDEKKIGCVQHDCADCQARALAQPEQLPVAWGCFRNGVLLDDLVSDEASVDYWCASDEPEMQKLVKRALYTHPPQRKPLTDDRIDMLLNNERPRWATSPPTYEFAAAFARVIERAHGIGGEHEA